MRVTRDQFRNLMDSLWYSEPGRWRVARWFCTRGYAVWMPPVSPISYEERMNRPFDDDYGDIHVTMRVEVKQITHEFTDGSDWPFPDFIVTSRAQFDCAMASAPRPYAFITLNADATHMGVVLARKWKTWTKATRNGVDGIDNGPKEYYIAPLDQVEWYAINCAKPDWDNTKGAEEL